MGDIAANLLVDGSRIQSGGGDLYLVERDAAKQPCQPHATIKTAYAVDPGTSLVCCRAPAADTHVPVSFGTSGALDVNIFGAVPETNKAFSNLAANTFTVTPLAGAHAVGQIVKLYDADDYGLDKWKNLGHLGGTTISNKLAHAIGKNEKGAPDAVLYGDREAFFRTDMRQSSKEEIDFILKEAEGKEYAAKYVVPLTGSRGHQIWVVARGMIVPEFETNYKAGTEPRVIALRYVWLDDAANPLYALYEG